ncbi:hypothetical protein GGQ92_000720 [Gracilibacillus halotolerans]|uniref:SPOR domain-containing protein n=1 Tax=Gracilibacillus halotolerans TaxID=74386 RepID=A0A841RJZ4_9BACI|nr:hypothetical protein [Gracilibacillus halotolerans]MBB6511953.1 hypothetical protein [Gracilibacillus halotolerans]
MPKKSKTITYPISTENSTTRKDSFEEENVFQRDYLPTEPEPVHKKKSSFFQKYKSFILSAVTAIVIGTGLGIMIMKMFIDLDPEAFSASENDANHSVAIANEAVSNTESTQVRLQIPTLQGYVIQAGVFSSEENAKNFFDSHLASFNLPYSIWYHEEMYYIFVHLAGTEAGSKEFHQADLENNENFYSGKLWTTAEFSIDIDEASSDWLTAFPEVFTTTLSEGNTTAWEQWLEKKPENPHSSLEDFVTQSLAVAEKNSEAEKMVQVLEAWKSLVGISK